jgi:two-component system, OmpR family, response regulator RegX3
VIARILVVDDEPALLDGLTYALRREPFDVTPVATGADALERVADEPYDLVVLDLMLPDVSGLEVCRRIRATSAVPIIMLTAKDSEVDKVVGLEVGADDYVTKPFSALELLGRVRALLRRRELDRNETSTEVHVVGALHLDVARHEATIGDRTIALTPSEFKVLYTLARQPEQVVSKREILEHLWDTSYVPDEHACDVHISNLRAKIEADRSRPQRIVTVRGIGYKLMRV